MEGIDSMDTRKRNVFIAAGIAVLVAVVLVAVVAFGGSSKVLGEDGGSSGTKSVAKVESDKSSKDKGGTRTSGDGTADNEVDASEVYGDSSDGANDQASTGTSASGSTSGGQSGAEGSGNGGSSENGSGGSSDNQGTGDADPGVKTEADGSTWTGYY